TPAQKALLEPIIAGQTLAALAHEEADSHYAPTHVATRATQAADGGWRLQGHKAVVLHAEAADVFLVSARISGETDDPDGISLFLIPA
ncbi:acyl-CoA dehydrogenase family protein, partial [Pseudomonas promysalinigenes]